MITWAMKKVFGTSHERAIRRMKPRVDAINRLEESMKKLSDAELRGKTGEFKEKIEKGAKVDDLLVPAFAVCREASRRALKMRHYDVQLIGGMVLHEGCIAEMRTGEGKTLVATLPCYLNALEGKGVHVVTVNDYLAKRDAEWMGKLYGFLGMTTGTVVNQQNDEDKKLAYRSDITYGQNNEFGFDYLRDNMKFSALDYAQRPLHYAIVDEVDSILIDEARTPLIISGQGERSSDKYRIINEIIPRLQQRGALHRRREGALRQPHRRGHRGGRAHPERPGRAQGEEPLRPRQPRDAAHPEPVPALAHALQARRQLHGAGGQGPHHRRVHRPRAGRAALVGRPAPGRRGQGERPDPGGEPDDGHHHLPEPLPHLQEALRHDRHRRHRGRRVPRDLQARRGR